MHVHKKKLVYLEREWRETDLRVKVKFLYYILLKKKAFALKS